MLDANSRKFLCSMRNRSLMMQNDLLTVVAQLKKRELHYGIISEEFARKFNCIATNKTRKTLCNTMLSLINPEIYER